MENRGLLMLLMLLLVNPADMYTVNIVPLSQAKYGKAFLLCILEIRSMERGICPIAVFYFALKRSFFNILKRYWSTKVSMLPYFGSHDRRHRSRDHKTRSGWFPIGGPLTPTHGYP